MSPTTTDGRDSTRGRTFIALFTAVGLVGAGFMLSSTRTQTHPSSTDAPSALVLPGTHPLFVVDGRYTVSLASTTRTAPFGGQGAHIDGSTAFDAELAISRGADETTVRIVSVRDVAVIVNGADTVGDDARAHFTDGALVVARGPDGSTGAVHTASNMPLSAARLLQLVLAELLLEENANDDEGPRVEQTVWGTIDAEIAAPACDAQGCTRSATATRLLGVHGFTLTDLTAALDGRSVARANARGVLHQLTRTTTVHLSSKDGSERFVLESALTVERVGDNAGPQQVARDTLRPLSAAVDDIALSSNAEARALDARIAGLTAKELATRLDEAKTSGSATDHNTFLWRATGLLQKEPALVDDLAARYRDAEGDLHPYRALLLDLLVGAGHPEAERALTTLLSHPNTLADNKRTLLFQRLALLRTPTDETIAFARTHARDRTSVYRQAAWITLGSAAHARAQLGDDATALSLVDELRAVRVGETEQAGLIAATLALGNTRSPLTLPELIPGASVSDANVRHATAEALGKVMHDDARTKLLAMTRDTSAAVARRAFVSLRAHAITDDEYKHIADDVRARAVPDGALADAVTLAASSFRERRPAKDVLDAVLGLDHVEDRHVKSRVRQMLNR
jgi:hypothetical protein